jgi:hypothetical protein
MTACGFLPDQIEQIEMHDISALFAYWRDHPPVHEILAAVHGIKPKTPPPPTSKDDPSGIGGLIAMFPSGNVPWNR